MDFKGLKPIGSDEFWGYYESNFRNNPKVHCSLVLQLWRPGGSARVYVSSEILIQVTTLYVCSLRWKSSKYLILLLVAQWVKNGKMLAHYRMSVM